MGRRYVRDNRGRFASTGATARGGRLKTAGGNKRETQTIQAAGARAGTIGKPRGLKPGAIKPKAAPRSKSTPDLSQSAFERRAKLTERRAQAAERAVAGADRAYASSGTKRAFRTADVLRSAADSYASYARRGRNNPDFSAADLFARRQRSTTAPRLSRSEKAAATRRANADKRFRENVRRMEADRRRNR